MKYLRLEHIANGVVVILNRAKTAIGAVHPKGEVFRRSQVFVAFDDLTEFTSDCLREVADFMDSKAAERRKTVAPKRAVQQLKAEIAALIPEFCVLTESGNWTDEAVELFINKLRQLSAV